MIFLIKVKEFSENFINVNVLSRFSGYSGPRIFVIRGHTNINKGTAKPVKSESQRTVKTFRFRPFDILIHIY